MYESPAVRPGTTTGRDVFLFASDGFFEICFCFQASRIAGRPAVGAYATNSLEVSSGAHFCTDGRIAGLPLITVVPMVPFATDAFCFASPPCAMMPFGK